LDYVNNLTEDYLQLKFFIVFVLIGIRTLKPLACKLANH